MEGLGESEEKKKGQKKKKKLLVLFEKKYCSSRTELGFIIRMHQNINKGSSLILIGPN
jgi:hypothetical protein